MPKGLGQLAKNLSALKKVPADASREAAEEIEEIIDGYFDRGHDPYGNPWADLASGDPSFLQKTHKMRQSLEVRPARYAGIEITIDDYPAFFHLRGTKKMVARPMLPTGEMPKDWQEAIQDAYARAMQKRYARNR